MLIFLDFDDVLFNTKKFKNDYFGIFKKYGVTKEIFEECYYDALINSNLKFYSPDAHIERVCGKMPIDLKSLKRDASAFTKDTEKYVFSDVVPFLLNFSKKNLFLISFSKTQFQKNKIFNSTLANFFKEVHIVNEPKGFKIAQIIKKTTKALIDEDIYFIDDRIDHLSDAKNKNKVVKTILLLRKEGRYEDKKNKLCNYDAKNLKEVFKIITQK